MSVFFTRRGNHPATTIAVAITGAGSATQCYAIINDTKQYEAGVHEVHAGDTITFGVAGINVTGWVKINGTKVLEVTGSLQTYDWTVPDGISTIEIAMVAATVFGSFGQITVTTD